MAHFCSYWFVQESNTPKLDGVWTLVLPTGQSRKLNPIPISKKSIRFDLVVHVNFFQTCIRFLPLAIPLVSKVVHPVDPWKPPIDFEDLPIVYLKNADVPSLCHNLYIKAYSNSPVENLNFCGFNGLFCRAAWGLTLQGRLRPLTSSELPEAKRRFAARHPLAKWLAEGGAHTGGTCAGWTGGMGMENSAVRLVNLMVDHWQW